MNTCSPWNGVVKLQGVWFIFGAQKEEMEAKFFLYANIHFFRPILHKFSFKNIRFWILEWNMSVMSSGAWFYNVIANGANPVGAPLGFSYLFNAPQI